MTDDWVPANAGDIGKKHSEAMRKMMVTNQRPHVFGVTSDWLPEVSQAIDKRHNGAKQQTGILDRLHWLIFGR